MKIYQLRTQRQRQRAVDFALTVVQDTLLEPKAAETALLQQFISGQIDLDELLFKLEPSH